MGTTPNDLHRLALRCAGHHEAGLRAHLAGGPTDRQEIVDEVHAYVADMIDDTDPAYQPTVDILLDRLTESGDMPVNPIHAALDALVPAAASEIQAIAGVRLAYCAVFPNDFAFDGWDLEDALDVLLDDGGVLVTDSLRFQVDTVRNLHRTQVTS